MSRVIAALLAVVVTVPLAGQGRNKRPKVQAGTNPSAAAPTSPLQGADSLNNLRFRNLGPSVGGGP